MPPFLRLLRHLPSHMEHVPYVTGSRQLYSPAKLSRSSAHRVISSSMTSADNSTALREPMSSMARSRSWTSRLPSRSVQPGDRLHTGGRGARASGSRRNPRPRWRRTALNQRSSTLAKDERGSDLRVPLARVNVINASQSSETTLAALVSGNLAQWSLMGFCS